MYTKQRRIKLSIFSGFLFILVFLAMIIFAGGKVAPKDTQAVPGVVTKQSEHAYSYEGKDGRTALELLKARTMIEQSTSGLVISIKGITASEDEKEFWAFYVNDKLATVGANDYVTKRGDKILWKLENY